MRMWFILYVKHFPVNIVFIFYKYNVGNLSEIVIIVEYLHRSTTVSLPDVKHSND